jgi:hypothetical protein
MPGHRRPRSTAAHEPGTRPTTQCSVAWGHVVRSAQSSN